MLGILSGGRSLQNSLLQCGNAQLFTLEGVIAAIIILGVTYFLFQSTMIISPISDEIVFVQIKQYGEDALRVLSMDTQAEDTLYYALTHLNDSYTPDELIKSIKKILPDYIDFNLQVYFVNYTSNKIEVYNITNKVPTSTTVVVSKYIVIRNGQFVEDSPFRVRSSGVEGVNRDIPILLEVRLTLWRI